LSALEQEPEVSVLAAPRLITRSGQQGKIGDAHTTHTEESYETGPVEEVSSLLRDMAASLRQV